MRWWQHVFSIILLLIGLASSPSLAGEVNNGAGLAEAKLNYALQKLDTYIRVCLVLDTCAKQQALWGDNAHNPYR